MKKGLWIILCLGIAGAHVSTSFATPFLSTPGLYNWTTFDFIGQELTTGQHVNGFFSFVTSGGPGSLTDPMHVGSGGELDTDRFFLAEANLNYDDGRFMSYSQQGLCADTLGGAPGGLFSRNTPCSPTVAPELSFTLDPDLSFLASYANSNIPFDVLMTQILSGPGLDINGKYGCSGGQLSAGAPADFGSNGYCNGPADLFGFYTGRLTAVPEAGTLALFCMGLLCTAFALRRNRAAAAV